jgi:tetratricopeptide (TPR) repeat protein
MDCTRRNWAVALEHINRSLRLDVDNLRARNLKVLILRRLGQIGNASRLLKDTLGLDRLDWWARHLNGEKLRCDLQAQLDIAHDHARAGFDEEAIRLLEAAAAAAAPGDLPDQSWGALPLVQYTLAWLHRRRGDVTNSLKCLKQAATLAPDFCFPCRLEEIAILEAAMRANPADARAPYYLGNLLYDRRRHVEAIRMWKLSAKLDETFPTVWRNLGIGYFNISKSSSKARAAYDLAFKADPGDARILYERDQLWKRLGQPPAKRLRELERYHDLVNQRDDLSIELCALYNQVGEHQKALTLLGNRRFQPWEGGEGGPLGQHVRSNLALGRLALVRQEPLDAREHFEAALRTPGNLGEARHLLVNQSDIHYWLGCACAALRDEVAARKHWLTAATFKGDFQGMSVRAFSEMTYFSACSWIRLGRKATGLKLLHDLLAYARRLPHAPAQIDYFATSLPTMLLFEDDLQFRQETDALFLQAQAHFGFGKKTRARGLLEAVLRRNPNHPMASDLLREI